MRIAAVLGASLLAASCAGQCGARGGLPPPRPPTVAGPDGTKYHLPDRILRHDTRGKVVALEPLAAR